MRLIDADETIREIGAIDENVLRVDIEWEKEWFNWGNDNEKKNE